MDIQHVYVSGYVVILAGRSRATADIDVIIESLDRETAEAPGERLEQEGFWGPSMPLERMFEVLADGGNSWIARGDEMVPHFELKFASDEFDTASLDHSMQAKMGGRTLPIGPLELQIAYKLYLGG
ncbi:MAG: hypothetical protein ABEI31_00040 [Halodesulfurarchaeum sp.]